MPNKASFLLPKKSICDILTKNKKGRREHLETNENLTEKLKYIGLNLEEIPDKATFFQNINFRIHKNYNEKNYKVYKFIDVNDIDIFLTPTHRLTDYTEKYAKALPVGAYLYGDTDENIERNIQFLKLIKDTQIEEIEELEKQQHELNKNIPYNINFHKDYLWQIYYSETSKRYFMLMPMRETECTSLFYVMKKQLENKNQKIYVPISYASYSQKFLDDTEIDELEKYLCYFAKDWPLIYEVYDKENKMSIQIVGKATIYDTIKSEYKIELLEQGEAEDFYKLIKILFILETQLSHHYKFEIKLDKKGKMNFYYENNQIDYKELIPFIKREYVKGLEKLIKAKEAKINLDKELKTLKNLSKKLDQEYFEREKQISTFLECKKTFFGRVRYFIKYKKKSIQTPSEDVPEKEEKSKLKYCERTEIKEAYTLEELLALYTNLDQEVNAVKDLELDIEAMNKRIEILKIKLKNANQYIKEIDEHKKSIFEFWKFTNKDEAKGLNEGTQEPQVGKKLKKVFNYELDFEDLSKQLDKSQRELFNKEDTDNIFIATTEIIEDLNNVINNVSIPEEHLKTLKQEALNDNKVVTFDIFGSISSSKDKIKTLGNIKHRENEKNKFAILKIKETTNLEEYKNILKNIAESISKSISKFKNTIEIPIYKVGEIEDGFNVFYINPENALKQAKEKETKLYKIKLKENTNCLAFTNIMYYNNTNQTLPLGMHVTDGILIDTRNLKLELIKKNQNYIITPKIDEPKPETLKINIFEYEIC